MRVLVTGGNGFLGSHAARALAARGCAVRALAQPKTSLDNLRGIEAEVVPGDLSDPASLRAACAGVEVVLHLAARVLDHGPAELFRQVNVNGTRALLDAAKEAGARRLVLVSSVAVHRYSGHRTAGEQTPRHAWTAYGASKIAAEDLVRAAHEGGWIEGVIARPGTFPFGPRDRLSTAPVLDALVRGRFPLVAGGRALVRTAYAENLAEGLALCCVHPVAAGRTYVLGDPEGIAWRDLLTRFARAAGTEPRFFSIPTAPARAAAALAEALWGLAGRPPPITRYRVALMARDCDFTSARAEAELGYRPAIGLDEAIARTVDWWRSTRAAARAETR